MLVFIADARAAIGISTTRQLSLAFLASEDGTGKVSLQGLFQNIVICNEGLWGRGVTFSSLFTGFPQTVHFKSIFQDVYVRAGLQEEVYAESLFDVFPFGLERTAI